MGWDGLGASILEQNVPWCSSVHAQGSSDPCYPYAGAGAILLISVVESNSGGGRGELSFVLGWGSL